MNKAKYLKGMAVLEFIGFGISILVYLIYWIGGRFSAFDNFILFLIFLAFIIVGPALGVCFITAAEAYELSIKTKEKQNKATTKVHTEFKAYKVADIVTSSEPLLSYDKKTQIPALSIGRVTKIYTDMAEVEFKVEGKTVIANAPYKAINKM